MLEDRTVGSVLAIVGAAIMLLSAIILVRIGVLNLYLDNWSPNWLLFGIGVYFPIVGGSIGLLSIAIIVSGAFLMSKRGKEVRGSAVMIASSIMGLIFVGGGFYIGTILVLIGGLLGYQSTKCDYSG